MVDNKLESVESVIIDEGVFKYVLVKVYGEELEDGTEPFKIVVRGHEDCEWHSDIYDRFMFSCEKKGLRTECLGGGRINHRPLDKYIKVYGYSQGFGKADHLETKKLLWDKYNDYIIETSDDGY